jgi:hypothetical protein
VTFDDILDQVITLLKRQGGVSYGAMKRRFDLDDAYLEDLKGEILFAYPVVDEDGRGLVWTGASLLTAPPLPDAALGMLDGRHALNTRLNRERGIRLSIRVGVHTGLTVIGDIGAGQKHEIFLRAPPHRPEPQYAGVRPVGPGLS